MEKKRVTVIVRRIVLAVVAVVFGLSIYLNNAGRLGNNQIPMPFGTGFAVVLSGSMEPTLSVDDLIVVRKTGDYAVGDVVVYQSNYSLIVHRVVSVDEDVITTRGDANDVDDDPISMENIKGKMVASIPQIGKAINLIKNPVVTALILVVTFLLTELSFRKEKEKDNNDLDAIKAEIRKLKDEEEKQESEKL